MKKNVTIVLSLAYLCSLITACASQEVSAVVVLPSYNAFEVRQVSNETGKALDFDVAAELTKKIISRLRQEGFNVAGTPGDALVISSSLISYDTRQTGAATCTVKSTLIDLKTEKVLGEIVTTSTVSAGGLSQAGIEIDQAVLEMAADDIVTQIERRLRTNRQTLETK
ncbi:MAG: LPS assembly lipoprotein LptE [Candidatus Sulfobium sp.]